MKKQPSGDVLKKRCPVNLLHIFRTPFLKNTCKGLLLPMTATELILIIVLMGSQPPKIQIQPSIENPRQKKEQLTIQLVHTQNFSKN